MNAATLLSIPIDSHLIHLKNTMLLGVCAELWRNEQRPLGGIHVVSNYVSLDDTE